MPRALCRPLAPCSHCPQPSGHPALTRPTRSPGHPPAPTAQALAGRQWRRLPLSPAAGWPGHLCTLDLSKPLHWHFLGSQLSRGQWIPEASVQRQPADPKPLGWTCSPQHPLGFCSPILRAPGVFAIAFPACHRIPARCHVLKEATLPSPGPGQLHVPVPQGTQACFLSWAALSRRLFK